VCRGWRRELQVGREEHVVASDDVGAPDRLLDGRAGRPRLSAPGAPALGAAAALRWERLAALAGGGPPPTAGRAVAVVVVAARS
jgi:hypothetical protein